jgi:hypothetical protein
VNRQPISCVITFCATVFLSLAVAHAGPVSIATVYVGNSGNTGEQLRLVSNGDTLKLSSFPYACWGCEPSTFVLGALGLLGLGFIARRKQNRVA